MKMIEEIANGFSEELIKIRRILHAIPELSDNEYKTSSFIIDYLNKLGIENQRMLDTGVVALIKGKKGKGRTLLIRADIDALPINENNDIPYKSLHDGVMHACGHDAHIVCALGMCMILKEINNDFSGNIKIAFQPAEESTGGALRMIENGVLDNPSVDASVALHVEPLASVGTIQYRNGAIMASPDDFKIIIKGVGGHGACPSNCINPIYPASELSKSFKSIVRKNFKDTSECVVSVCTINSGTKNNIIPDTAEISGTARSLTDATRDKIEALLEKYAKKICKKYKCKYEFIFNRMYPPVINNSDMNNLLIKSAGSIRAINKIEKLKKSSMTGDDFSYFANRIPSVYFKLGAGNEYINKPLHSQNFNIDEKCLTIGAALLTKISLNYLEC